MNKRSVAKKRPAKAGRSSAISKAAPRKAAARKATARKTTARKATSPLRPTQSPEPITALHMTAVTVAQVTALNSVLRAHKFRVGQTVSYTSSPITRPGASGSYKVVRLLPSDGDDYQYRIKNPGEAFERVAKESQLELEH